MAIFSVMADVPNPVFDSNGNPFSGAVLKAFLPGTTTSTSIAIDSAGGSPQTSITYNAQGKLEVTGNEILPYIDKKHKWGIFANATDAAANTPFYMGPFDNVEKVFDGGTTAVFVNNFATLALAKADLTIQDGDALDLAERIAGKGGGAKWDVVLTSTVTPNTFEVVQSTGIPTLSLVLRPFQGTVSTSAIGITGTDDSAAFQSAVDFTGLNGLVLIVSEVDHDIELDINFASSDAAPRDLRWQGISSKSKIIFRNGADIVINKSNQIFTFIKDITFDYSNSVTSFIRYNMARGEVSGNEFIGADAALVISGTYQYIQSNRFTGGKRGLVTSSDTFLNAVTIQNNFFASCSEFGINLDNPVPATQTMASIDILENIAELCGVAIFIKEGKNILITSPYAESCTTGIQLDTTPSVTITNPNSTPSTTNDIIMTASEATLITRGTTKNATLTTNSRLIVLGSPSRIGTVTVDATSAVTYPGDKIEIRGFFDGFTLAGSIPGATIARVGGFGVGAYQITFDDPLPTSTYSIVLGVGLGSSTGAGTARFIQFGTRTAAGFQIVTRDSTNALVDVDFIGVEVNSEFS